ncbi:MAG: polyamine aminopropyltransferase, partial [Deltaproteobacteria bacterium]
MSAVLVAAISGIVYELLLGTTASFLLGDSVLEWSLTIGCFLAAMGLGSWLTRYVRGDLLPTLIAIEAGVAVVGGFSALSLFAVFAWLPGAFRSLFYLTVGAIGIAVGLEIPLLTRALKRFGALRTVLSSVFAVDYGGALLASLLYPLLLYP